MKIFGAFVWRLVRVAVSLGMSFGLAQITGNDKLIWAAPIITAAAKAARDKWGLQNIPF